MEEASVRGKVAVLETRREDRQVIEGVAVALWSTAIEEENEPKKKRWFQSRKSKEKRVRKNLLHKTKTDEHGIFVLPRLKPEEYILVISEVKFRVTVLPKAKERLGRKSRRYYLF